MSQIDEENEESNYRSIIKKNHLDDDEFSKFDLKKDDSEFKDPKSEFFDTLK